MTVNSTTATTTMTSNTSSPAIFCGFLLRVPGSSATTVDDESIFLAISIDDESVFRAISVDAESVFPARSVDPLSDGSLNR